MTTSIDRRRASSLVPAILVAFLLISALLSGCGGEASSGPAPSANAASAITGRTIPVVATTRSTWSQHERIMAEQGRMQGVTAADRSTTTPPEKPPQTELTAVGTASIETPAGAPSVGTGSDNATQIILTDGQTPLQGSWDGDADRLASFLLATCPSPRFTVPTSVLADYYMRYAEETGLRADLLWAQMMHETGNGSYGGDVRPDQNNYAGIGATGHQESGFSFPTAEAGVMAHAAHMVAYVYETSPVYWADTTVDPRFDCVFPRGVASVLADLDGRWAVPGVGYGERIEAIARAMNSH